MMTVIYTRVLIACRDNYILELIIFEDLKPDNIYVNMQEGDNRFNEVKIGDMGNCSHVTSEGPTSGAFCGAPTWSSPELILQLPWNTASDIWAFGLLVRPYISTSYSRLEYVEYLWADDLYAKFVHMIYGSYFSLCMPQGPRIEGDRPNLLLDIMLRQLHWFAPFLEKIVGVADAESADTIAAFREYNMPAQQGIFETIPETEISKKDNKFIRKMMKLDWRDRPSARDLLEDEWWIDE